MKPTTCLIAITGIASVFYLGYSVDHATRSFERRFDSAVSESNAWRREADSFNQRVEQIPSLARTTSQQAVKGGAQQFDRENVGAPTEIIKAGVKNTEKTAEKASKDTIHEMARAPQNVSRAIGRATGLW
jgi:hypothetical protein